MFADLLLSLISCHLLLSRQGNTQGFKRVDGPSDKEVAEKKKKQREVSATVCSSLEGIVCMLAMEKDSLDCQ